MIILLIILWFLNFFKSFFHLVFLPTTLTSLPPEVLLLNHNTTPRDSATKSKKHPKKSRLSESNLIEA